MEVEKKGTNYIESTIRENNPDFIRDNFVDVSKGKFQNAYRNIVNGEYKKAEKYCTSDCIKYMMNNKEKLKLNEDFDIINVQSMELVKYRKTEKLEEIDAKMYVIYTDYKTNNNVNPSDNMNYCTEKYNITFRKVKRKYL